MAQGNSFPQAPLRNGSLVGAYTYSDSGEFSPRMVDLAFPGRGVSLAFARHYRSSLQQEGGLLGRGWTLYYAQWIEEGPDRDLVYHDGSGRRYPFLHNAKTGTFLSPDGCYASIVPSPNGTIQLHQRYGTIFTFQTPQAGGRLLTINDRNGNTLTLVYSSNETIRITDPLGQYATLVLDQRRIAQVEDHVGRVWRYRYNQDGC